MRTGNGEARVRGAAFVCALALLAGCGGGGSGADTPAEGQPEAGIVQAGAPGEPSQPITAAQAAAGGDAPHTAADVDFMRRMIHHHAQALVMTNMVRARSASREIPLFARRLEISQEAELETMERWLTDRAEQPPTDAEHRRDHGAATGPMPGMLSAAELDRLAAAAGRDFDRAFLRAMLRHHRGALTMVARLAADGGGTEPEIGAFTRHVEADQGIEIARMQQLLDEDPSRWGVRRAAPSKAAAERATRLAFAGGEPRICVLIGS